MIEQGPEPDLAPTPSPWALFLGFMRIAALSFGGVLPWARFVLVERRRWITSQDFTDTLALCQLLPGPNIVNMSVAIGARFHGPVGSLASITGLMALPVVIVLVLATLYGQYQEVPAVGRALAAMAAAAAGLVTAMAMKMAEPLLRRRFWQSAPFIALTFAAVAIFRLPLLPVVLCLAPLAVAAGWRSR
ncbi:chromate transporter [uncultured Enterovirga sp.]|uniref:chromate transporter n=1 Tax=uncultured Enterovirga sp. TaxID=2026352 RepID=UPI0035CB57C2